MRKYFDFGDEVRIVLSCLEDSGVCEFVNWYKFWNYVWVCKNFCFKIFVVFVVDDSLIFSLLCMDVFDYFGYMF